MANLCHEEKDMLSNNDAHKRISVMDMNQTMKKSLEEQRSEYNKRSFLATPLSGLIAWFLIGISGILLPDRVTVWILFAATGSIVYLALLLSKLTGENFLDRTKPKNEFDNLFLFAVGQAVLVYSIAIPFFLIDYTSLPLTVGILTGTMWLPFSWIIKHWVGIAHALFRTITILILWYVFPGHRFISIPFAIVIIYVFTITILNNRSSGAPRTR